MKDFIKENWFKIIIAITALIVAIFLASYLKQQTQKNNAYMELQCTNQAPKAFKELAGVSQRGDIYNGDTLYDQYHYSNKLGKCFIEIQTIDSDHFSNDQLYDANSLEIYAMMSQTSQDPSDPYNSDAQTYSCNFYGKGSQYPTRTTSFNCTQNDYNNLIKPYMAE